MTRSHPASSLAFTARIEPLETRICLAATTGLVPLTELGSKMYLDQFQGGLYPGGTNIPPAAHATEGKARGTALQPVDAAGNPASGGKSVFISIGMSNTTQEFSRFIADAASNPAVDHNNLVIVDGARGGQTASTWDAPTDANYDRIRDQVLAPKSLTEAQVQVAWVKVANANPTTSLPSANADAYTLLGQMGDITRSLQERYPNLEQIFFSSRIYAGYATTTLNPEPYAYESGFAVKWLVEAQIEQMQGGGVDPIAGDLSYDDGDAPWIGWGPYLWADGIDPRAGDGLTWQQSDFNADGTHPSDSGRAKVSSQLMSFMLHSPFSRPWFAADAPTNLAAPSGLQGRFVRTPSGAVAVDLRWTDNAVGEYGFIIERRESPTGPSTIVFRGTQPNQTKYRDTTVVAGKTYLYRVRAYAPGVVSQWSNVARVSPPTTTSPTSTEPSTITSLRSVLAPAEDEVSGLLG